MKGLSRGGILGAQSGRKIPCVFQTAERCAKTICFGVAFTCVETKTFRRTKQEQSKILKLFVSGYLKASSKQAVLACLS
jgi:hypothetical protein